LNDKTVSLETALQLGAAVIRSLPVEEIHIIESVNRVCAENCLSLVNVPDFERSRVDGYAITLADCQKLSYLPYIKLEVKGMVSAGSCKNYQLYPGQTVRIMTGAKISEGTAAIVKQEEVAVNDKFITISTKVAEGDNIETIGYTITKNDLLIAPGELIKPENIGQLASAGLTSVKVYRKPEVYVISCGDELVLPGHPLPEGMIYQSNVGYVSSKCEAINCRYICCPEVVKDDVEMIVAYIHKALAIADLVIICGGTAQGEYDLVKAALQQLTARFLFTSIASRPGRGVSVAVLNNKLIINLPGNPGAVGIIFDILVAPWLQIAKGIKNYQHNWININLGRAAENRKDQRMFCRAVLVEEKGSLVAWPSSSLKNHTTHGLCTMVLDLPCGTIEKGSAVKGLILSVNR